MVPAASTAPSEPCPDASGRPGWLCRPVRPCSASVPSPCAPPAPLQTVASGPGMNLRETVACEVVWYRVLPSRVMMIKLDQTQSLGAFYFWVQSIRCLVMEAESIEIGQRLSNIVSRILIKYDQYYYFNIIQNIN